MTLESLEVQRLRNITHANLTPGNGINLIYGANGSGKTSLLEAAHLLSAARSHRHSQIGPLIQQGEQGCLVLGRVNYEGTEYRIGVQRGRGGDRDIRVNDETVRRASQLARIVPTLTLGAESLDLALGAPAGRRRFLNWGVFHVKPSFGDVWDTSLRALAQRNRLLRQETPDMEQLAVWTGQLIAHSQAVHEARAAYWAEYVPVFERVLSGLTAQQDVSLEYDRGWEDGDLASIYEEQLSADKKRAIP